MPIDSNNIMKEERERGRDNRPIDSPLLRYTGRAVKGEGEGGECGQLVVAVIAG